MNATRALAALLAAAPLALAATAPRPNVILVVADDMGFSDLGCYGAEIRTPNLDRLAAEGLRYTQFYNGARCCPSRAALLTGLHPHQAGMGNMVVDQGLPAYSGDLNDRCATLAELLVDAGYRTYLTGKWHLTKHTDSFRESLPPERRQYTSTFGWPLQRGFQRFFGTIHGAGSFYDPKTLVEGNTPIPEVPADFYYTDAITDRSIDYLEDHARETPGQPFFLMVAYTAPHWPLHAREADIAAYRGVYDSGWDTIREARFARQRELGLFDESVRLAPRDPDVSPWDDQDQKALHARAMEVYAAQMTSMDAGIGRILAHLGSLGHAENTLVLFLSDNGGSAEFITERWPESLHMPLAMRDGTPVVRGLREDHPPGPPDTYASYARGWAQVSNTPFREYKHWIQEGGIATPLLAWWPAGISPGVRGTWMRQVGHLVDIVPTVLELAGKEYPSARSGRELIPLEGTSLVPNFRGEVVPATPLFWEHHGNRGARLGDWKIVGEKNGPWSLHDLDADRTELVDLAADHPDVVADLADRYAAWAARVGVVENPPRPKRSE